MFWLFVILGSLTLMAVLYGLVTAWSGRRPLLAFHLLALALVLLAMKATHDSLLGRMALVGGMAIEVAAWFAARSAGAQRAAGDARARSDAAAPVAEPPPDAAAQPADAPAAPAPGPKPGASEDGAGEDTAEPAAPADLPEPPASPPDGARTAPAAPIDRPPATEPPTPQGRDPSAPAPEPGAGPPAAPASEPGADETGGEAAPEPPRRAFTTIVLLQRPCATSGEVFLASLRRGGRRDARLIDPAGGADATIRAADLVLELRHLDRPWTPPAEAPPPTALPPHGAHATITSAFAAGTPGDAVVRLHHRAHAALAEFAPVRAVVWPDAGHLVDASELDALLGRAADPGQSVSDTCTRLRSFELDGTAAGMTLCDTVGLGGLGLPDIQLIAEQAARASMDRIVHDLVDRCLRTGGAPADESEIPPGAEARTWRVTHTRAAFSPDRPVVQITPGA